MVSYYYYYKLTKITTDIRNTFTRMINNFSSYDKCFDNENILYYIFERKVLVFIVFIF